jgi:thymidylate synthase
MINLIASVFAYQNKLAIGNNENDLLFKLPEDIKFFQKITSECLNCDSKCMFNVIVMGKNTFNSLNTKYLKKRINIVLTRKVTKVDIKTINKPGLYTLSIDQFIKFYKKFNPNVFVVGGALIYNFFLKHSFLKPTKLYITQVKKSNLKFELNIKPEIFMPPIPEEYSLIGYSSKYYSFDSKYLTNPLQNITEDQLGNDSILEYRILYYKLQESSFIHQEHKFLDYMSFILKNGNMRDDRTNIGTISYFGNSIRYDISTHLPLSTTKQVSFKIILEELLWFCRGDTDAKILQDKGIKIWNGNSSREFLDKCGLHHYPEGVLGPVYGFQMRFQGAEYSHEFSNTNKCNTQLIGGFDQLSHIEHLLKTNPFSRRIFMTYWNACDHDKMALIPCHGYIQFYVTEEKGQKYLSSILFMRGNDVFLAQNMNVVSYTTLTYILALKCDMKPKELIYMCGDGHIYQNHTKQVMQQIKRKPTPLPILKINKSIETKDWKEMKYTDFEIIGYFPHPSIKAPMAI